MFQSPNHCTRLEEKTVTLPDIHELLQHLKQADGLRMDPCSLRNLTRCRGQAWPVGPYSSTFKMILGAIADAPTPVLWEGESIGR